MQNVMMTTENNVLVIRIDLSQNLGVSKSGKSLLIASTGGNVSVPASPEIKLGINCYRPA